MSTDEDRSRRCLARKHFVSYGCTWSELGTQRTFGELENRVFRIIGGRLCITVPRRMLSFRKSKYNGICESKEFLSILPY